MMDRFHYRQDREAYSAARVKALEALLIKKGVITDKTVDTVLDFFETKMGPFNGAKIVARAWVDPTFKDRLVADTPKAIAELQLPEGMAGAEGEHMRAVANAPDVHNLIICTLCSCYPWPVLGLPPYWYKDPTFRSRAARASPPLTGRLHGELKGMQFFLLIF
jgi:nitrile hydratase